MRRYLRIQIPDGSYFEVLEPTDVPVFRPEQYEVATVRSVEHDDGPCVCPGSCAVHR